MDHGANSPTGDANGPDGEVMLDVEIVGAIAPGASVVVYFAPNTDAGFLDAITTAIHDANAPSVDSVDQLGRTRVILDGASADDGHGRGLSGGGDLGDHDLRRLRRQRFGRRRERRRRSRRLPGLESIRPRVRRHELARGAGAIAAETVWDDGTRGGASGGGVSGFFPLPAWQKGISARMVQGGTVPLTMRGVPDVAGDADPNSGYVVRVDGADTVIGGTSAVAPLWAALIARIDASAGKAAGYINPRLYGNPRAFRDITQGANGEFSAQAGWDACTGLGSPNGGVLAGII